MADQSPTTSIGYYGEILWEGLNDAPVEFMLELPVCDGDVPSQYVKHDTLWHDVRT